MKGLNVVDAIRRRRLGLGVPVDESILQPEPRQRFPTPTRPATPTPPPSPAPSGIARAAATPGTAVHTPALGIAGAGAATRARQAIPAAQVAPVDRRTLLGISRSTAPGVGLQENIRRGTQTATSAAVRTTPILRGMGVGFARGALVGRPIVGGIIGALGGWLLGEAGDEMLANVPEDFGGPLTARPEDFPEGERAIPFAAEFAGGGLSVVSAGRQLAQSTARLPPSLVGNFLNKALDSMALTPRLTTSKELAAVTSASVGEALSEYLAPGQTGTRITTGIVFGVTNPTSIILGQSKRGLGLLQRTRSIFSEKARLDRAAAAVRNVLREATISEDPIATANALDTALAQFPNIERTAAQAIDSPALRDLQAYIVNQNSKYGAEAANKTEGAIKFFESAIRAIYKTASPDRFKEAALLRAQQFRSMLSNMLAEVEKDAAEMIGKVAPDDPMAMAAVGREIDELIRGATQQGRRTERALWAKVPQELPSPGKSVIKTYDSIEMQRFPEETLPPIIEGFVARTRAGVVEPVVRTGAKLSEEGKLFLEELRTLLGSVPNISTSGTTSGQLIMLRSRALALGRDAAAQQRQDDARVYGRFAEAALDDLMKIESQGINAFTDARQFSFAFNEVFTRAFAGEAQRTARSGAARIPPELLGQKLFGPGEGLGAMRFRELREALEAPLRTPISVREEINFDFAPVFANLDEMWRAQERVLSYAAARVVDAGTGRVSRVALFRFRKNNKELLNTFPEIATLLESVQSTQAALKHVTTRVAGATRSLEKSAIREVTGNQDPVVAVGNILAGKNSVNTYQRLANTARNHSPEAVDGLAEATIEYAVSRATNADGVFSPRIMQNIMTPIRRGDVNLLRLMVRGRVMTQAQADNARRFMREARIVEKAASGRADVEELLGTIPMFETVIQRVIGARVGARVGGRSGATLIAAASGARYVQNAMAKVPQLKTVEIISKMVMNPKFMAEVLRRPTTAVERLQQVRSLHAYLLASGLVAIDGPTPEELAARVKEEASTIIGAASVASRGEEPKETTETISVR